MKIEGAQTRCIAAPAERVWSMVAEITRMHEWSPETVLCRWTGPPGPRVGATFEGCNRLSWVGTWWSRGMVTHCEPGRSFGFVIGDDPLRPNSEWLYTFESLPSGSTLVTESYRMVREPMVVRWYYRLIRRARQLEAGVTTTLDRLQRIAEDPEAARVLTPHEHATPDLRGNPGPAVPPEAAWYGVQQGKARILDLRTWVERATWGYPPGAKKVSFLVHAVRPDREAIYLCQHAVRSKWPRRKGASEVDKGFKGWLDAGLPVQKPIFQCLTRSRRGQS